MENEIEKISDTEVKQVIPQPDLEVKYNIDELIAKKAYCLEQAESFNAVADDCQILIDKAIQAGCVPTEQ